MVKGLSSEWGSCYRTVSWRDQPTALSSWGNSVAIGYDTHNVITILDAITGSQMAVLFGHVNLVRSVAFSSDGRSLASGSYDTTIKLWDVQTGGIIKTFHGHDYQVHSVSISGDYTRIASGSLGGIICLWDIQTGECLYTTEQEGIVQYVSFLPTDPQHIVSISGGKVQKWNIDSQQISSLYNATSLAFSPDYTQLILCHGKVITVRNFNSGAIVTQSSIVDGTTNCCCFSPDGNLIAAAAGRIAYVWDITGPDCCLIETFIGHTDNIRAIVFSSPSSFISASYDGSAKFWQIGALSKNQTATDSASTPLTISQIRPVSLQARAGVAISSDRVGEVKTWDLSTGLCKTSFQTPAGNCAWRDIQLINGILIVVWYKDGQIYIWDTNEDKLLQTIDTPLSKLRGLRVSGDGSKVFCLTKTSIHAWSTDTGMHIGEVKLELGEDWFLDPLQMDDSRIWIRFGDLSAQGWDFGTSSSSPTLLPIGSAERPTLDFIGSADWWAIDPFWVLDTANRRIVFQLSGKYTKPSAIQWDGQYLVAGYESGEILILDFHHMYSQ